MSDTSRTDIFGKSEQEMIAVLKREVAELREALAFVLSHPELLPDIAKIRAILKGDSGGQT